MQRSGYPFGETRYVWGGTPTDRRFTGQREESGLGSLYDYNARFYSPVLGRFISADTIVPDGRNPQAFNRYAYTLNSPLNYIDPSGHMMQCPEPCGGNRSYPPPNALPGWYEAGAAYEEYLRAKYVNHESEEYVANAYSNFEEARRQARSLLPSKLWTPEQREETYREWGTGLLMGSSIVVMGLATQGSGNGIRMPKSGPAGEHLENTNEQLLTKPTVQNQKLRNIVTDLYKGITNPKKVGNGTTMDAVRNELAVGEPTNGKWHIQKAQDSARGLQNWLGDNLNASYHDQLVARSLLEDLLSALGGN